VLLIASTLKDISRWGKGFFLKKGLEVGTNLKYGA